MGPEARIKSRMTGKRGGWEAIAHFIYFYFMLGVRVNISTM